MMPGETHPAAPGTAADLVRCQGCASLQQNLNEYVEALITLKQKIINTDNLLTEYQKKCDELQFARRENSTLHHQVEQMLQKISPLQKCQEELGSLKAELEEKKSSLKLYQDTRQEYARVKEECLKSDAQKKKLEAKVKKLEEAAVRQTQDFKQLRNEKKILEKEFKKTQERLDEFSKQKNERGLRHIGTQISSDSYGSIDKRKVKLLLKELWLCVNSAHRLPGEGSMHVPEKPAKENIICGASREDGALPAAQGSLTRTSDVQACLTELSMEVEGNCASCESAEEDGPSEGGESSLQHVSLEESHSAVAEPRPDGGDKANFSNCGRSMDEDLQAAINFFKLPPPLLSPVPSPPLVPPHLSSFSSPLVPETCFGEYTDSSDNETNPLGNSPESASEDDAAESQDYFGLLGKSKGGNPWVGKPKSKEADVDALRRFSVHRVTPGRTEPLAAAPREPSTISSLAQGRHWAASPSFVTERDNLDAAERQVQVRKPENSVQAESTLCRPARNLWVEMSSGNLAQENEVRAEETEPSSFPLVKRTLNELSGFEGNPLSSKTIGSPRPGFKKCSLIDGVVSELDQVSGAGCLQRSREREAVGGPMLGPPEPENSGPDDVMAAAGLDGKGGFSSSSTSVSVFSKPQSSWLKYVSNADMPTDTIPRELSHTEELHMKRLDAFLLQAEPPKPSLQEHNPGNSVRVLNSVLGAPALNDQQSRKVESTNILKGMTKMYSLPQSSFQKVTKDGQCESRDPVPEFTLRKSNLTTLTCSQAGSVMGGSAFVESTSWHHSDVLRRGGRESPRAPSEREQTGNCQSEQVVSALEGRGFSARLELLREGASCPPTFKATAALLPNQVSVITKQMRPEKAQHTSQEQWRPCGNEQTLATEGPGNNADDLSSVDKQARDIQEVALVKSPSPEVSTSWKIPDLDSPSGSLPAENFDYSTNSRLSFSSEDSLSQSQDTECESALQGEMQTPSQTPHTAKPDTRRVEAEELLPAEFTEPCGDTGHASTEAPVVPSDILSTPQHAGRAFPESHVTTGPSYSSTLSSTDETEDAPQNSPPAASCCYTGIREQGEEDTEVEESEAFSCSEGEHEAEIPAESREQHAVGNSGKHVDNKAELAEARSSADVGYLTSALQHFNISTFPDLDRLSTSEVVMFLESCQLRDYSSGDSVSECSSKGTLSKESKQSVLLGGKCGKQLCEEETAGISEEWIEPEEGDDSKNPSQHVSCSLENLSKVLTKLGQELHEDCSSNDPDNLFLLNTHSSPAAEGVGAISPNETPTPHFLEVPQPSDGNDTGSSPTHAESDPKHSQSRPEEESDVTRCSINGGEGGLAKPGPLLAQTLDPEAPPRTEQSSICEADSAFQYQLSTVTSEVINVLLNKDQNVVIEKGDNWAIINGVAVSPDVEQVILCDTPGDGPISQDQGILDAGSVSVTSEEKPAEASQAGTPCPEPPCGSSLLGSQEDVSSCVQNTNFDKSRLRTRPVKPSIWVSSNIYEQTAEAESVAFDHTYCNWKSESVSKSKNRSKISNKDQSLKPGKTSGLSRDDALQSEVTQPSDARENTKPPRTQAQPVVANADTSTPTDCSPDTLSKIRQEVGPPLPPLLAPLIATPPRTSQPLSPLIASASPSPASPAGHISPLGEILGPPGLSSWPEEAQQASPPGPSPSPSTTGTAGRIMSSPLQFCAATPKHALPVPGRLPPCAPGHATVGGTQENSVKILDTMYPELSARARTLNLLKGNLQLSRGSCVDGKVLIGFKAITSTSTAFVKTGSSSGGEGSQETLRDPGMQQGTSGKRTLSASMLRSAKRLRLDSESPEPESTSATAGVHTNLPGAVALAEAITAEEVQGMDPEDTAVSPLPGMPKETVESHDEAIARALKKIAEAAFDLLPVIRSHVYVGNISKKPVMRDQEKEVVYEFSTAKKHLAECLLRSILSELKLQKTSSADHNYLHALCRVYVGICRQLGDLERARLFCYSLLKEDFPESEKLALFIANTWQDIFLSQSVISQAMQLVARHRAKGEVQNCLRAFLCWEKNAPVDVGIMVSKLLLTIQLCPKTEFQSSEKFGEDLSDSIWEYVFAIDLLCCHQKWVWTHDHVISKELWPVMDKWIKYRKGHVNITYTPDVIVASILRLIGRLGQLGLKEGFPTAVKNISSVIGMFIQHARDEDIPWGIQLAAVYALCELSPSNPAEISKILEAWRRETSNTVPSAIISCLEEVGSLSVGDSDP